MLYDESIIQYDQTNVNFDGSWALTVNETASFSEGIVKYIQAVFKEVSSITELIIAAFYFRLTINDISTSVEILSQSIAERLRGVIGIIKQYVGIGSKDVSVSILGVGKGIYEILNAIPRQYDDSSIMYDQATICYNNYISSDKPTYSIGVNKNKVSVNSFANKPIISKK